MSEGQGPVLQLIGVTQQYGEGELAAIMGASGSGKSTLLSIAGGVQKPTTGEVVIEGTYLSTASPGPSCGSGCALGGRARGQDRRLSRRSVGRPGHRRHPRHA